MQTFLPFKDFRISLKTLDDKRLGKQRVETYQIINAIETGPFKHKQVGYDTNGEPTYQSVKTPWYNHPATQMWIGYTDALKYYYNCSLEEWLKRGFNNTMKPHIFDNGLYTPPKGTKSPWWLGNDAFHMSHKSNLLRKDRIYYGKFKWDVPDNLPYIWPTKDLTHLKSN